MAISQAAGTEIIRCANFEDQDDTHRPYIIGEQHHIYTVLSIVAHCNVVGTGTTATLKMYVRGWDAVAAEQDDIYIFKQSMSVLNTFVWNDKFSFNGYQPTGVSNTLDTATEQTAIAAQGGGTAQWLRCATDHASDNIDIVITYIDQNNA